MPMVASTSANNSKIASRPADNRCDHKDSSDGGVHGLRLQEEVAVERLHFACAPMPSTACGIARGANKKYGSREVILSSATDRRRARRLLPNRLIVRRSGHVRSLPASAFSRKTSRARLPDSRPANKRSRPPGSRSRRRGAEVLHVLRRESRGREQGNPMLRRNPGNTNSLLMVWPLFPDVLSRPSTPWCAGERNVERPIVG